MAINFPTDPEDGKTIYQDGQVCVYHEDLNTWECKTDQSSLPVTRDIYTTDVKIPDQDLREEIRAKRVSIPTTIDDVSLIKTQYDANQALLQETVLSAKNTGRVADLLDFTQNTAVQGYWVHTQDEGGDDVPSEAEFFAFDENGDNTTQFADFRLIKFNDNGIAANPGTENVLATARVGDQLVMQELGQNHFGQYIITSITTYNTDGVIYRELGVKVYKKGQRAFGSCDYLAHCSVRVMRPEVVIVQDDQPVVSERGVLWYRESDDHLFISNYSDGYVGGIGPQWTDLTATGGGGAGVHVGELEPVDPAEGDLWFDTGRLELYVYYVEGEDGGWLPSSPLGARVAAGEALQQQILGRVDGHDSALNDLYSNQADFLRVQISNDVTTAFRIKSGGNTLISTSGNKLGLYNLSEPTNPTHAVNLGYADTNYLSLANGGTITNLTTVDRASGTAFKVKKSGVDHVKIEAGGKIFCNYNMELDDDDTTVPNKGWVKSRIAAGGGGPTDKYDDNFYSRSGVSGATLNQGDVMFMNDQLVSTTDPHEIAAIAFSPFDFDWDKCAYSGVIRARSGGRTAGFYQIYDYSLMENRMMILYVSQIKVEDGVTLGYESGCPCRFQGVFFE